MSAAQITTAAELDALPVGSVVRTEDAQIYQRTPGGWDCLSEDGSGGTYGSSTVLFQTLPHSVSVLYRPDAPEPAPTTNAVGRAVRVEVDRDALGEAMLRHWWNTQTGPDADAWETLDAEDRQNVAENSYGDVFLDAVMRFLADAAGAEVTS